MKTEMIKLVTFRLGAHAFATDVFSVDRVLRYTAPNTVPDVPAWIDGVIDHAGDVIPVVDLRKRIGLEAATITPATRTLVLSTRDGRVGAIVDAVHEVAVLPTSTIAPPPALFRGLAAEFVRGIARIRDQIVVLLDVDRVLASDDRIAFDEALSTHADSANGVAPLTTGVAAGV